MDLQVSLVEANSQGYKQFPADKLDKKMKTIFQRPYNWSYSIVFRRFRRCRCRSNRFGFARGSIRNNLEMFRSIRARRTMKHPTAGLAAVGRAGLEVAGGGGGAAAGVGSSHNGAAGFEATAGLGARGTGGLADAELGPYEGLSILI